MQTKGWAVSTHIDIYKWKDSRVQARWLLRNSAWNVFVGNDVGVRFLTSEECDTVWLHYIHRRVVLIGEELPVRGFLCRVGGCFILLALGLSKTNSLSPPQLDLAHFYFVRHRSHDLVR